MALFLQIASFIAVLTAVIVVGRLCLISFGFIKESAKAPTTRKNKWRLFYDRLNPNLKLYLNIFFIVLLTRIITYLIAYWGYRCFGGENKHFFEIFSNIWTRCDSPRYLQVAQEGYMGTGEYQKMINIVFLPLYPFLVNILSRLTFLSYFYSAITVSFISLTIACYYFYKLLLIDYSERITKTAVKYFLIYPYSFFLSAVYTESTFMAACFACIFYMRQKKWLYAGIAGSFASFCRTQGILLIIPVVFEILLDIKEKYNLENNDKKKKVKIKNKLFNNAYLWTGLIPLGYGFYLLVNKVVTGDWFKYLEHQKTYWRQTFTFFPKVFVHLLGAFNYVAYMDMRNIVTWGTQIVAFFVAIVLIIVNSKKIRTSYLVYGLFQIVVSYSAAFLMSGSRYLIGAFPIFISAALLSENEHIDRLLTFFCILYYAIIVICYTFDRGIL